MKKIFLLLLCVILGACGSNVKRTLGINNTAPNEFNVLAQKQLEIPKKFTLPEPKEANQVFNGDSETLDTAKQLLFEDNAILNDEVRTNAELSLLEKFGNVDMNIRATLDEEYRQKQEEIAEVPFIKEIISKYRQDGNNHLLDPEEEKQRLSELK